MSFWLLPLQIKRLGKLIYYYQIRELNEPFEINGHKAMYPSNFGIPSLDINCICAFLQRTRLTLDQDELETLKELAK